MADRYLDLAFERLLDEVASREPAPGGGSVAAITLGFAAGLVGMAARFSERQLADHAALAEEADRIRHEAGALAEADAEAYAEVLRSGRSGEALLHATDIPLQVCDRGVVVAERALRLAQSGNPNLRGDAITALLLAAAAVRSAAYLIELNTKAERDLDEFVRRSADDVAAVSAAIHRAGLAGEQGYPGK